MIRKGMKLGIPIKDWNAAKKEARDAMIARAKTGDVMTYSELVHEIKSITLGPHDPRLFHMLGEVSSDEEAEGRGMLTAVVVGQESGTPGTGFFELADELGRDTSDHDQCWLNELKAVHAYWASH